jgi:hypothetical protein
MTRHPKLGAVERRPALWVNHREIRNLELRRSGALQPGGELLFPEIAFWRVAHPLSHERPSRVAYPFAV